MWWNKPDKSEYLQGSISAVKSNPKQIDKSNDEIKPQESQDNGAPVGSAFFTINPETSEIVADVHNINEKSYDACPPHLMGVRCKICGQDKFKCSPGEPEPSEPFDLLKEMNDSGKDESSEETILPKKTKRSRSSEEYEDNDYSPGISVNLFKMIIPLGIMITIYFIVVHPVMQEALSSQINETTIATQNISSMVNWMPWVVIPLIIFLSLFSTSGRID